MTKQTIASFLNATKRNCLYIIKDKGKRENRREKGSTRELAYRFKINFHSKYFLSAYFIHVLLNIEGPTGNN